MKKDDDIKDRKVKGWNIDDSMQYNLHDKWNVTKLIVAMVKDRFYGEWQMTGAGQMIR